MRKISTIVLVVFALVLLGSGQVDAQATYVGTETCNNCHGKEANFAGNQWTTWVTSKHNMKWRDPDEGLGVIPKDAFTGNLDLSTDPDFAAFGTNAPKLSYDATDPADSSDGTSGYRVTIGSTTHVVNYTLGGTGDWKQRFMTKIGNSIYILPIQYNEKTQDWVTYHTGDWYDSNNQPLADREKADAYERRCIGCHSVNPEVSYSDSTGEWTATVTERNIGCEACHGPGSEHASTADPDKILNPATDLTDLNRMLEVCGACHSRGSSKATLGGKTLGYPYNDTEGHYRPGLVLADFYTQTKNTSTMWPDLENSKKHHQQYLDMLNSPHAAYDPSKPWVDLTCFTCHDPHDNTSNTHMVRDMLEVDDLKIATTNDDNTLCLACHATHGDFALIKKEMVADPTGTNLDTIKAVVETHTRHPYDPGSGVSRCSKCHMAKVAKSAIAYDIHGHTFEPIGPEKTLNFQAQGGMPSSCAVSCHRSGEAGAPTFGIADASLTDWTESGDVALADRLLPFFGVGPGPSDLTLSLPDGQFVASGWEAFVPVSASDLTELNIVSTELCIIFDPSIVEILGISMADALFEGASTAFNVVDDTIKVSLARAEALTGEGTLFFIQVHISSEATTGTTTDLSFANVILNEDEFIVETEDGSLVVGLPGDVSANGLTTAFDAGLILQTVVEILHLPDPEYPALTLSVADVTRDGSISALDASEILRFTVGLPSVLDLQPKPLASISGPRTVVLKMDQTGTRFVATVTADSREDILAGEFTIALPNGLQAIEVTSVAGNDFITAHRLDSNQLHVAFAGAQALNGPGGLIQIVFEGSLSEQEVLTLQEIRFNEGRIPVTIEGNRSRTIPSQYALGQNIPNPFNSLTEIRYSLTEATQVRLVIYNLLGQKVRVLVDDFQPAGFHRVVWDSRDNRGRLVGSGVYLYRLTGGEFAQTKRMILLR